MSHSIGGPAIKPEISVIIPAFNSAPTIGACLQHALASDYPSIEIIVVDDGSSDGTAEIIKRFPVRYVRLQKNSGAAFARNQGVSLSQGDLLTFIDSDVLIQPDTLRRLKEALERLGSDAVFGIYAAKPAQTSVLSAYKNLYCHYVNSRAEGAVSQFSTCCGAVRKAAFLELSGFDDHYRAANMEDVDFGYRLAAKDKKIYLDPTIQVEHLKSYTFFALLRNEYSRAKEWTRLLLIEKFTRHRKMLKAECNLSSEQLISLSLPPLVVAFTLAAPFHRSFILLGAIVMLAYLFICGSFFNVLLQKMGPLRAFGACLLHFLCQVVNAAGSVTGMCLFSVRRR